MANDSNLNITEKHFAIVTRVNLHPSLTHGRVFFKSDTLTNGSEFSEPATASFPIAGQNGEGMFWVPQVGDQIEVEIQSADEHPVPRIVRGVYSTEDTPADEFLENYPFRMGWKTRAGHIILFDNKPLSELVQLSHKSGSGFVWTNDDETHAVEGDQIETVAGTVARTISGTVSEVFKAEVDREVKGKLTEIFRDDLLQEVSGNLRRAIKGDMVTEINGALAFVIKQGITWEGSGGAKLKLENGKVGLGTDAVELLDKISSSLGEIITFLQALTPAASTFVSTSVGPGVLNPAIAGSPSGAAEVAATNLGTLKTEIDSIKGGV